jgi:glycosyltransferase involved in cell wall biosynthesis
MGVEPIDIIVTTTNRIDYLKRTLNRIRRCTKSPYKLHIIDDASSDGTTEYVISLFQQGVLETITLHQEQQGQMNNLMQESRIGASPVYVHVDDDMLCPNVEPDWLSQGIQTIRKHKDLGIMALDHPGAKRVTKEDRGDVVVCQVVGGTFSFIRRKCSRQMSTPHRHDLGTAPQMTMCSWARRLGYQVGYIKGVYCYHFGENSVLTGGIYKGRPSILPTNWETLRPTN